MKQSTITNDNTIPFGQAVNGIRAAQRYFMSPLASVSGMYFDAEHYMANTQNRERYRKLIIENLNKDNTYEKMQECQEDITCYVDTYRRLIFDSIQTLYDETPDDKKVAKEKMLELMQKNSPDITTRQPSVKQTFENFKHFNITDWAVSTVFLTQRKLAVKHKENPHPQLIPQ